MIFLRKAKTYILVGQGRA